MAAAIACLAAPAVHAQNGELPRNKRISWLSYNADHAVSRNWSLHFDGSYRPMFGTEWRQWLVRPGVNYRFSERWQLSLTYSYFSVHPKGLDEASGVAGEHRLHQQVEYSHPWRGNTLRHRFRLEERYLASPWKEGVPRTWKWQDRPRYMLRMDKPLARNGRRGAPLMLTLYDEILLSFASPSASDFEQNRVYAGATWRAGRHLAVDLGVFYQTFHPQNGGRLEHNFVFVTLVRNQTPLRDLFRWLRRL